MDAKIHILHLHPAGLSWISLDRRLPKGKIVDSGLIPGEAATALSSWSSGKLLKDSEIFLYDGRPQYFSFVVSLPAKAAKEAEKIVPLRVRQEIGLGEDAIRWSSHALGERDGQVEILVFVARIENQQDIADWREKNSLKSLWVSADLSAICALRNIKILDENMSLVTSLTENADLVYYSPSEGRVLVRQNFDESSARPELSKNTVMHRVALDTIRLISHDFAASIPADAPERFSGRLRAKLPDGMQVNSIDAILLGGLFEVGIERPKTSSFFGEVEVSSPIVEFEKRLRPKSTALVAASLAIVLIASFSFARYVRGSDTERVHDQATKLDDMTELYEEQIDVLIDVKDDRLQLVPFIEAVYKVAPADSTLQSLDIAENGLMIIAATTKTQEAGTAFFKDLANTKLFDDIQITYLKLDDGKKWVRLQINAKIRGWKK